VDIETAYLLHCGCYMVLFLSYTIPWTSDVCTLYPLFPQAPWDWRVPVNEVRP